MGHLPPTIQKMCFWLLGLLYAFLHRLETERLAGSLVHIYMDVTLLSAFGLSTCTYED